MSNIWPNTKYQALLIIAALSLVANIALALIVINVTRNPIKDTGSQQVEEQKQFPYLSKRIFTENQNDILINFIPLRTAIREYVAKTPDPIGVYFEYLPSGISIGVNDTLEVNLASLLKVPVVIAVYKQIENGKIKKNDVLTIKGEHLDKRFGDVWKRGEGTTLTAEEAINFSLVDSDNTSSNVLLFAVGGNAIDDVFDSLDVPKDKRGNFHIVSPKSYSSILRSLYLSSYLKEQSSNEILDILTRTKFNDRLPVGVPKNTKVAHKIGVFSSREEPEETYSDCGIIYVPQRPYLLCIMAKSDEEKTREHMQQLSKMVYGYVAAVKGEN